MKKIFYIIILFSFSKQVLGQTNVAPNSGFELYTSCPPVNTVMSWTTNGGSPDYFHTCSTSTTRGVPQNYIGYEMPLDGNAYVGIYNYCKPCYPNREYIGAPLTQSLAIGTKYFVSVYISKADSNEGNWVNCSTNKFGFRFSTVAFTFTTPLTTNFSHVHSNAVISNTNGWTKISGSFVADSNYKFCSIGNFYDNNNTDTTFCNYPYVFSYYYLDKVCISTDSMMCNVLTGFSNNQKEQKAHIFPNPTSNDLSWKLPGGIIARKIKITNSTGTTILALDISENTIDILGIPDGLYFVEIIASDKTYFDKITVRH